MRDITVVDTKIVPTNITPIAIAGCDERCSPRRAEDGRIGSFSPRKHLVRVSSHACDQVQESLPIGTQDCTRKVIERPAGSQLPQFILTPASHGVGAEHGTGVKATRRDGDGVADAVHSHRDGGVGRGVIARQWQIVATPTLQPTTAQHRTRCEAAR